MGSMGMLVLVLIVLELLWGRASLVVFAVFFNTGMPSTTGVLQAVFNPENWSFVAVYSAVGGVFAALVFSTSVVSIPMILDRDTDALTAGITSIRVVLENPLTMLLWGALITLLVGASLWAGSVAFGAGGAAARPCQLACLPRRCAARACRCHAARIGLSLGPESQAVTVGLYFRKQTPWQHLTTDTKNASANSLKNKKKKRS